MKKSIFIILIGYLCFSQAFAQMAIHDRAIVAQQERMVFKQWDADKFYPKPNRILGVPTNPNWFLTWALHPNYQKLDRRPLSPLGEQTQRMSFAAAMNVSSNYNKQHSDTIGLLIGKELMRISGALSGADPLFQLYYKNELSPLENIEANAFRNVGTNVISYSIQTGAYDWYLEQMKSLAERYGFAKNNDMERGQRILMYHRIMLEMRRHLKNWEYKLSLSEKMLANRNQMANKNFFESIAKPESAKEEELVNKIIQKRILLK